jgi:hypothetical protein
MKHSDGSIEREQAQLSAQAAAQQQQLCDRQQAEIVRLQGVIAAAKLAMLALDKEITRQRAVIADLKNSPATAAVEPISTAEYLERQL